MAISFTPITLSSGFGDDEGALVMREGILIAVISRLGPLHDQAGRWFIEASFLDRPLHTERLYEDLSDLEAVLLSAV
jgi:hypothetical protein